MSTVLDTVIFDLGGVLIDWNPRHLYRKLFRDESAMEQFLAEVCNQEWNELQDAGRDWDEAIAMLSARHAAQAPLIRAYRERWEEMLGGPLPDTVEVLRELRERGARLYALTNWAGDTFEIARERYAFLQWFEHIVVSGREGVIKPDPAIFRLLLAYGRIEPARAVYIDDTARHVAAAHALGMHGLQFRDAASLRAQLAALGLLGAKPAGPTQ